MNTPKRINYNLAIYLIGISDFCISIALFYYIKNWIPGIEVIIPKLLTTHTPDYIELIVFSLFWLSTMGISGLYRQIKQKAFVQYYAQFATTILTSHLLFSFLFLVKNDVIFQYGLFHFFLESYLLILIAFSISRFLFYLILSWGMQQKRLATYAIIIGNESKAALTYTDFLKFKNMNNYHFIGFVETLKNDCLMSGHPLKKIGHIDELQSIIESNPTDEVIIALDNSDSLNIQKVLNIVKQKDITIKLVPDINSILEGSVKLNNIEEPALITIRNNLMPVWQVILKVTLDYIVSIIALAMTIPFVPLIIMGISYSSKGSIFYTQTRIGKNKKPFKIIKFRSMYSDAEKGGPALTTHNDQRITPFGRVMRKWHIDELPQFINVIMGDMSIVGPRPERLHYINQITKVAPHYTHIFRIKPGITSWGMVKYGYAENVDQMVERLKFDIIYLENMSFLVDLKIILHTLRSVLIGDGK